MMVSVILPASFVLIYLEEITDGRRQSKLDTLLSLLSMKISTYGGKDYQYEI